MVLAGEAGLLLLGWVLARWLDIDPLGRVYLDWSGMARGTIAALPMLLGLYWALRTQTRPVRQLVQIVQDHLGPLLVSRSSAELAGIAILAGVAEEFLFRGVMQVGLGRVLSDGLALTITSVAFGLVHFLTPTYALLAFLAGAYLGALFLLQGNLLVPIVAHTLYDFIALICLVRRYRAAG